MVRWNLFSTADKSYQSYYMIPCSTTGETKWLTTTVDVSSANKTNYVVRGTFNGTLSIIYGKIDCDGLTTDQYKEVTLSGYFRVRWSRY
ncbi:MAG: hypothetical protein WC865_08475 [Bacteroidales bacterium]